ncbi:MAG: LysR family transcriptional regulator [Actinobacteria bacterium]|nr:LysR family transcriptional regulator [Actinomycetota bacterium]
MSTITQADQWLGVELRHLAALAAVAREGSFGRAADSLGYTQSAVSQQIATLERIVGETLVERPGGPRAVSLTEAGALLLRHAEAIVARLDAARADIAALRAGETGMLRVGTYQSIGARVLPGVMRRFRTEWPGIELGLSEPATDPELYGLIESGELDLAFCSPPLPDGPFEALELMSDPYVLLVPADSPLAARKSASLDDLGDHVLIGANTCSSGFVVERELEERGYDVDYAFRSDDNGTVQGLVTAGFGVALLPLLAVAAPGDERVRVLRLVPKMPRRAIAVVWHRDRHRSPAARAFVEIAREVSSDVERELLEP